MTTTKQVRKRLDLARPVPTDDLLEIIEIANHAPMGGNLERNRWIIVIDGDLKAQIAERFAEVGRPYLAANSELRTDDRSQKVIDSAEFLVDHLAEVPALVIALRLDRPPLDPSMQGGAAAYYGSVLPGCGASSSRRGREASVRHGRRSTSSTKPRSPSSSAFQRPSPRCACWPSATTPASRSPLHLGGRCERSRSSTVGRSPSSRSTGATMSSMLLIDAANVVGSRPTGWWRDRRARRGRSSSGFARRLRTAASPPRSSSFSKARLAEARVRARATASRSCTQPEKVTTPSPHSPRPEARQ